MTEINEEFILAEAKRIRGKKYAIRKAERDELRRNQPPLPTGQYRTIVMDPPWDSDYMLRDVRPNQVLLPYPTMRDEEIEATWQNRLPIADDGCFLFLWTTHKKLPVAFQLMKSWGFEYSCTFIWEKGKGFQPINSPQYVNEFCLLGRKNKPQFVETKAFKTAFEEKPSEHSRKPDCFYELLRRVAPAPRIDIYNREPKEGFNAWGNEAFPEWMMPAKQAKMLVVQEKFENFTLEKLVDIPEWMR